MVLAGSSSLDMLMQFRSDFQLDWSNLKDWRTEWLSPCGWQFCWNCLAEHLPVAPLGNWDFSQYGSCCIILIKAVIKWWKINSALQWEQGHFVEDVNIEDGRWFLSHLWKIQYSKLTTPHQFIKNFCVERSIHQMICILF